MPETENEPKPRRRWDRKDRVIALLGLAVALLLAVVVKDRVGATGWLSGRLGGEKVAVFDVILDREDLSYIDVLFDRPLGAGREGSVLAEPPATISPAHGGVWRWRDAAALRFEPSGRLNMATEYTLSLIPERLLGPGQRLVGDLDLEVVTDQFVVSGVTAVEEPAPEAGKGAVILRGELRFNYGVEPENLGPKVRLLDAAEAVPVLLETSWASDTIGFRTAAILKRPAERKLELTIDRSLTPADGNVPLPEDFVEEIPIGSSEKLAVRGVSATPGERESTIKLSLSSPVAADVAGRFLKSQPAVELRVASDRNDLVLTGPFEAGKTYRIEAAQGLPATDGAVLAAGWSEQVSLANLEPVARFQSEGYFLSASGARTLAVETINVGRFQLSIDRVYRNNLFSLFQYQSYQLYGSSYRGAQVQQALGDRIHEETFTVKGETNRRVLTPISLDRYVRDEEPGFYRVAVSRDDDYSAEQRWVLVTDLGMVAKWGDGELAVWVSSFADLEAVAGARVTLLSDQNQVLAEGSTGGEGVVRFGGERLREGTPYLLLAERGGDFSFLLLEQSGIDVTGLDVGGAPAQAQGYDAFLYGERDLYRPGEVVEGLAVVRDKALKAPPAMPLVLVHSDPQGQEQESQRVTTDARGLAAFRLELAGYAETGHHLLEAKAGEKVIGQYRFQVEEFIPDRIKVEIQPASPAVVGAGEIVYEVSSAYLFGPPAAGLAVESRARLVEAPFAPKGFEAFTFANPERKFQEVEIASDSGELDEAGRKTFRAVVPPGLSPPAALEAVITARAQEKGGRGVTAMTRVPVHPFPRYVGLRKAAEGYADPGQPVAFEWVTVAPDGSPAPAGALSAELYHDRWNTLLRRGGDGNFRYESVRDPQLVETRALPAGAPRGTLSMTPPRYGAYRLVLTDLAAGSSTEVELYASGWGFSPWAIKSPGRVELDLDLASYAPGATATVQVRAPFPGKLLLTVERQGVLHSETHRLTGNTATVTLPVAASWRPNVYVTATLIRGAKDLAPGEPGRAFGAVPLAVDRAEKQLTVAITAPQEMRPETPLEVKVTTAPGAVVTVAAVDEGILRLIGQQTPDPFSFFYRKLALAVRSFDTFALLLPEVGAAPAGGGEGESRLGQFVSTASMLRVEPVALWSGVLEAGADGTAVARFEVPDFQGNLRLMAVAIDGDRFGSGEKGLVVRDRVVALPTLPRFLQLGDRLEVPVAVRNDTGRDGEFEVAMTFEQPGQQPGGGPETLSRRLAVANGSEGLVYLPLIAGQVAGVADFTVTVEGNGERTRSRAKLPLRHALPPRSLTRSGSLTQQQTTLTLDGQGLKPETVRQELTLGPVPVVNLKGRLRDLLDYPYGCLEQTVSRTFPLVYLADLARQLEPDLFEEADPEALVDQGLRRVGSMQLPTGGFSMWPDGDAAQPWASLWATHLLVEAGKAGHYVAGEDRALEYATSLVTAKASYTADELDRIAYALFILARADRADRGSMDFLRERHAKALPSQARALLAAAYAAVGSPDLVPQLVAGIADAERVERQTGGNFASTLRNRALLLLALLEAQPDDPRIPELADRIAREAESGEAWTTQENAWAFLALGQLFSERTGEGTVSLQVRYAGREIGAYTGEMLTFRDLDAGPFVLAAAAPLPPGRVYYSLAARGVPTDAAARPSSEGLEIERSFLTRDGGKADLAALEQGDLVVMKTRVRSVAGPVENVVVSNLLPPGLEVENPRLRSSESLPWVTDANLDPEELDLRDDRVLAFTALPANQWQTIYTVLRAVVPGTYKLPPPQAEAMYDPRLTATGEAGEIRVAVRK